MGEHSLVGRALRSKSTVVKETESSRSTARLLAWPSPATRTQLIVVTILSLMALVLVAELFCRFVIGLGNPPLYQADEAIEYLLQPSKSYRRFHHRFDVNRYSMRADDFPRQKSDPKELRVLVVGDSVVYGGVLIDQNDIGTEILKRELQRQLSRPVVVGNGSAKSWGPPNELAYLERYGTLDADVVVLELSSHDYADAPTFVPTVGISADYPNKTPSSAVADLFETYLLPRYLHYGATPAGVDKTLSNSSESERDIVECRNAERDFFKYSRAHNARVVLVQHLTLPELMRDYERGYAANRNVASEEHIPYVDDAAELRAQLKSGHSPYLSGDAIHLNRLGQLVLARVLQRAVNLALTSN
jgi:hypothetical protein